MSGQLLLSAVHAATWVSVFGIGFGALGVLGLVVSGWIISHSTASKTLMSVQEKTNTALNLQNDLQAQEIVELKHRNRVLESQLAALYDTKLTSSLIREFMALDAANHKEMLAAVKGRAGD